MKILPLIGAAAIAIVAASVPARAQVVIDMSVITCGEFLKAPADRQDLVASWMQGYFSATKNLSTIDLRYVSRNSKVVGDYCKTHKSETLMNAIQKKAK